MKKTAFTLSLISLISIFTSCKKDDDSNLSYGNANISKSNNVIVTDWTQDYNDGKSFVYHCNISWSTITQNVIDNGAIIVYEIGQNSSQTTLPYSTSSQNYSDNFAYSMAVGQLEILYTGFTSLTPASPGQKTYKVVIVSPIVKSANPNVNWKNYNEVSKLEGIKEVTVNQSDKQKL